jgi:hypothetical protein
MSSNLAKAIQFAGCEAAAAGEAEPACYRTLRAIRGAAALPRDHRAGIPGYRAGSRAFLANPGCELTICAEIFWKNAAQLFSVSKASWCLKVRTQRAEL